MQDGGVSGIHIHMDDQGAQDKNDEESDSGLDNKSKRCTSEDGASEQHGKVV